MQQTEGCGLRRDKAAVCHDERRCCNSFLLAVGHGTLGFAGVSMSSSRLLWLRKTSIYLVVLQLYWAQAGTVPPSALNVLMVLQPQQTSQRGSAPVTPPTPGARCPVCTLGYCTPQNAVPPVHGQAVCRPPFP